MSGKRLVPRIPPKKVAVLTHSYGKCFTDVEGMTFKYGEGPNDAYIINNFSVPGAQTATIRNTEAFKNLIAFKPKVTFILLGGNDITYEKVNDPNVDLPKTIAANLENLSAQIEREAGSKVRIVGLESRVKPRDLEAEQYNKVKNRTNRILKEYWAYTRVRYIPMCMSKEDLASDGVHLSKEGAAKLTNYIQKNIAHVLKHDN